MSAFVVFSMMGFYPVTPGVPVYSLGSPYLTDDDPPAQRQGSCALFAATIRATTNTFKASASTASRWTGSGSGIPTLSMAELWSCK